MSNHVTIKLDGGGRLFCDPDPVKPEGENVHIKFEIQAEGYTFPASGAITVHDGNGQFPEPSVTSSPTCAKLKDKNTAPGSFKYDVHLLDRDGKPVVIDPVIENQPK
jgi:hypothetical protein